MKIKSNISLQLGTIFVLLILSLSANSGTTSIETSKKPHQLATEINLCGVFPISVRPDAGPDRRDAFLIAIDEINAQTGVNRILPEGVTLNPIVKDDLNTAEGGVSAANSCISDGAHLVIGSSGSTVSAAMASVLTPYKIIQISYASSSPSLSDRSTYPYFMRTVPSEADQAYAISDLIESLGLDYGATISTDDIFGTALISQFLSYYVGIIASSQTFSPGSLDVSQEVQAIADSTPQFVLLNAIDNDARTVFEEAYKLGIAGENSKAVWIITDGSSNTATFSGSIDALNGMQYSLGTSPSDVFINNNSEFESLWSNVSTCAFIDPCGKARTGALANSYARYAYDAVYLAAYGLASSGQVEDSDALLASLYNVTFVGAGREYHFNELGEVDGNYEYVQLIGNNFNTFGTWTGSTSFFSDHIVAGNDQTFVFNSGPYVTSATFPTQSSSTSTSSISRSTGTSTSESSNAPITQEQGLLENLIIGGGLIFGGLGVGAILGILTKKG